MITDTLPTPYYAVIFTSLRSGIDNGYKQTSERMMELAKQQRGFLGADSARGEIRITVSYWKDVEAIKNWKENAEHTIAREKGKKDWYLKFKVRIAKIEREYYFEKQR